MKMLRFMIPGDQCLLEIAWEGEGATESLNRARCKTQSTSFD